MGFSEVKALLIANKNKLKGKTAVEEKQGEVYDNDDSLRLIENSIEGKSLLIDALKNNVLNGEKVGKAENINKDGYSVSLDGIEIANYDNAEYDGIVAIGDLNKKEEVVAFRKEKDGAYGLYLNKNAKKYVDNPNQETSLYCNTYLLKYWLGTGGNIDIESSVEKVQLYIALKTLGPKKFLKKYGEEYFVKVKDVLEEKLKDLSLEEKKAAIKKAIEQSRSVDLEAELNDDKKNTFKNKIYEEEWTSIQKFIYRREQQVPGFRDFVVKKLEEYSKSMPKKEPLDTTA